MIEKLLSGTETDQPVAIDTLPAKHALLVLAEGFEDAEAVCALDVLRWTRYRPAAATVAVDIAGWSETVHGAFGTGFRVDLSIDRADASRYDGLVVPGGFHNLGYDEAYDERLRALARDFHEAGKPIATMCVGALPIAEAGVLAGGCAATYALSARHDNPVRLEELDCRFSDEPVVEWDGIISCSGPAHADAVMYRFLALIAGSDTADEVKRHRDGRSHSKHNAVAITAVAR